MSLWNLDTPPVLYPNAVATPSGWADPVTGELYITITGLSTYKGGSSELGRVFITGTKKIFGDTDYIVLEADFTEKVVITSGTPTISATINGNSRTFTYFLDSSDKTHRDSVTSVTISSGGSDYEVGDVVTFTGSGSSATGKVSAVDGSGAITAIDVIGGGTGYASAPTVAVTSDAGTGATLVAVLGHYTNGSGTNRLKFRYQVVTNETATSGQIVISSPITGNFEDVESALGDGAAATAVIASGVTSVSVTGAGTGYTSAPTVVFTGGTPTTEATAVAVLDKQVASITITAGGSGYTSAPTVGFSGGGGSSAAGTAVLATSGAIKSITVGGSGTNYTNGDTVTFTGGGGSGAAGTLVTSGGNVTSVTITAGGSGYTSAPTVTITSGTGSGNTFTAVVGKAVASVTITNGGTGYTSVPTVSFTSGGGTGAAGTAVLSDLQTVKSITVTSPGTGYGSTPTVSFTGGGGSGATATATRTNVLSEITITAGGSQYWTAPTVGFSGGSGSGAAGTAVVNNGKVTAVTITNPGSGYSAAPTIAFTAVVEAPPSNAFSTTGIATGFSIDAVHPTVGSAAVSGASETNHFISNDFFTITLTASKTVYVTGSPYITVTINGSAKHAVYASGSKSTTLVFKYEIASGDQADATEVTVGATIVLDGGTIKDIQGNTTTLTFSAPTTSAISVN